MPHAAVIRCQDCHRGLETKRYREPLAVCQCTGQPAVFEVSTGSIRAAINLVQLE
jgi:hypothetical protein